MLYSDRLRSTRRRFVYLLAPLLLVGGLMLAGCDSTDPADDPIATVAISPDSVALQVGEQADFTAIALTASGDTVRDVSFRWRTTDPGVFTVEDNGLATARAAGTAFCGVDVRGTVAGKTALVPIGLDSARVRVF